MARKVHPDRSPAECSTIGYDIAVGLDDEPPRPHATPGSESRPV